jgi:hypothetical protein
MENFVGWDGVYVIPAIALKPQTIILSYLKSAA